ncbi:TIGR04104 family putative zinc finger protein [Planomicrobium stackebrandtii]|uniref:TIGR04104 family putative zinc finger protein n=1 Tax=Planomicrobium stackebrandtii TaxID=253160 RepID=UPI00280BE97B|nr:TIGR04104 family putative zinc finger protein [Planomicrobium stackebrandtii]
MQQCVNCRTPFSWKQVSKSLWLAYKPIACPNCGSLHKVQFLSRLLASIFMVIPIYAAYFFTQLIGPGTFLISVLVIMLSVILAIPYLMRYRLV